MALFMSITYFDSKR